MISTIGSAKVLISTSTLFYRSGNNVFSSNADLTYDTFNIPRFGFSNSDDPSFVS